ncbi:MAG: aldehyde dehydrogenase family protein [Myxococcota bacterium]|nr:aldehyde dehydrogenase family protein [Myxococcota bacterium]
MAILTPLDSGASGRRRLALASPATLEPIGEIEIHTAADVDSAVARARKAQVDWAALPISERARFMYRALDVLLARQEDVLKTVIQETGKPRTEALQMEIFAVGDALNYYAKNAAAILKSEKKKLHGLTRFMKRLRIVHRPLGVVGVISPWNGPFVLAMNPVIQALMAGNTAVLKPSEVTPFSGLLVGEIFAEAGLPEDVLQVLTGDGETGAALCRAGVDKVAFTGSVETGRKVAVACAEQLIPCTLELGGKDAMIVCDDANIDYAAAGAVAGAFMNTGQYCCGTERVYVVESVADAFTEKVVERVAQLRQGAEGEFDVGAIFWPRQLEIIEEHMADARSRGARILAGGRRNPDLEGLFYEPTVVVDVDHTMQLMREETFGPILPIMRVANEEEAIERANDSDYGLGGSVWTRDNAKGVRIAQRMDSGSICVNDMTMTYGVQEAPFGGRKASGIGQVNGETGLRGYCHAEPILVDRRGGKMSEGRYPYSVKSDAGLQKFIQFLWGTSLGRWLS